MIHIWFTDIHECHDIARLIVVVTLVSDPHLDACNLDTRCYKRQVGTPPIIVVTEEMRKKEVAVLIILVHRDAEFSGLWTATTAHGLWLTLLLWDECRCLQFAELQLGLDTEQCRTTVYQRRTRGHAHVTGLDVLDNLIFLALISKFKILAVEVKCRSRIVGHVELHLVPDSGWHIGLDLLIKVKISLATLWDRQRRVVSRIGLDAHVDDHRTCRL